MIHSSHRFHGHNSLKYVYHNGQTVRGPLTSMKYIVNTRRSTYRMSVVVSKKVNKSAVARNRIRRRLYEAARQHESQIVRPYDIVVTVFSDNVLGLSGAEVQRLVSAQLKQAGILSPSPAAA